MAKENLLIVISTSEADSIMKFPLLYGGVSIPRGYWKRVHIMFWGESIITLHETEKLQNMVEDMQGVGVEFSSCVVCAEEYGVVDELEALGIPCEHTGELLTQALKDDETWATMTI